MNDIIRYLVVYILNEYDLISLSSLYKGECLFVRYAFSSCKSYDHQTFHDASLGPKEGRRGVGIVIGGWRGGAWVKFHPGTTVAANIAKLSTVLS